ncbi:MAG: hypothetical protein ACYDIC_15475 [Desulfobaccales bacterium]
MERDAERSVMLQAYAGKAFAPVARAFVEKGAIALGLGKPEALDLALATKEVFSHLGRCVLKNRERVEIRCSDGGHYVLVEFTFPAMDVDLHAFNLTAAMSAAAGAGSEEMGLVLASRSVDRFAIARMDGQGLKLRLFKEKAYPLLDDSSLSLPQPLEEFSIRRPNPEELKLFARLVKTCYRHQALPEFFNYPGKLVDMLAGGNYDAALALGPAGEIGGGIFWHREGTRVVECFGPYLFNQKPGSPISGALLESCIGAIARTEVVVLFNRFATPEFAREHFEFLASVQMRLNDRELLPREAWFRLLHEDLGSIAWVHPEVEGFLRQEYQRLVLPREIRHATHEGEQHPRYSVLSTQFDRSEARATLRPMWFGQDFDQNLAQHLQLLQQEGILNIFFYLDVGQSWQVAFTPALLQHGFQPFAIFPYFGEGDVVLFHFQGASS